MTIIDLSHFLEADIPLYPSTELPVFDERASIETDGYREMNIALFPHTGTHMDAPTQSFLFAGLPLKIKSADGSPVRAVAILS